LTSHIYTFHISAKYENFMKNLKTDFAKSDGFSTMLVALSCFPT